MIHLCFVKRSKYFEGLGNRSWLQYKGCSEQWEPQKTKIREILSWVIFKLITFDRTGYLLLCNAAQIHFLEQISHRIVHWFYFPQLEKKIQNQLTKTSFYMQSVLNLIVIF